MHRRKYDRSSHRPLFGRSQESPQRGRRFQVSSGGKHKIEKEIRGILRLGLKSISDSGSQSRNALPISGSWVERFSLMTENTLCMKGFVEYELPLFVTG